MEFKVGQSVVHITHGVGVITGVEQGTFGDKTLEFYVLEIKDNGAPKKVFAPTDSAVFKLRHLADNKNRKQALEIINSPSDMPIDHSTWNRRYREYMDLIHSGDLNNVARVYRALIDLKNDKDLSFGERKLLDHSRNLIEAEFIAAGEPMELPC